MFKRELVSAPRPLLDSALLLGVLTLAYGSACGQIPNTTNHRTFSPYRPKTAFVEKAASPTSDGKHCKSSGPRDSKNNLVLAMDWNSTTTLPLWKSGTYTYEVGGVNDILYQYQVSTTQVSASTDDIAQLVAVVKETKPVAGGSADGVSAASKSFMGMLTDDRARIHLEVPSCKALDDLISQATQDIAALKTSVGTLEPSAVSGVYPSIPLRDTLAQWEGILSAYDSLTKSMEKINAGIGACDSARDAYDLLVDHYMEIQDSIKLIDARAKGPHVLPSSSYLDRTKNGTITLTEMYKGNPTKGGVRSFSLLAQFSQMTASGGFLVSTIQNRTYTSVSNPNVTAVTSVLQVGGNSGVTPALVALLNYHDPITWFGNTPDFGFALSAGPVIGVTNGKADTSVFGIFAGGSVHLYKRLFITSGIHFGQFADFPTGFTAAGQAIPANFGTLSPNKRYTGRLAFAITFRGKDPTTLAGNPKTSTDAKSATTAGVKQ